MFAIHLVDVVYFTAKASMKKIGFAFILMLSFCLYGQGISDVSQVPEEDTYAAVFEEGDEDASPVDISLDDSRNEFIKATSYLNIPTSRVSGLAGVSNGYYLIAGVYSEQKYAERHVQKINKKGHTAKFFLNPDSSLLYVYLEHHLNSLEAVDATSLIKSSRLVNDAWILEVVNSGDKKVPPVSSSVVFESEPDNTVLPEVSLASDSVEAGSKADPVSLKLIQKADLYYDKLWYAEAAELYDLALARGPDSHSYQVLRRAGESHYYNTNMEPSYKWYDIIFDRYRNEMTPEDLFRYANTAKGTGKYAKAKRLMRIYDKEQENYVLNIQVDNADARELVLDGLRNSEASYDIQNLPINSEFSDFAPMFYEEDKVVFSSAMDSSFFHTRRYKWNNQPFLDLYVAKVDSASDDLRPAKKFSKKINTRYHEASVTFSPDGKTMYFTRNNYGKKLKRDAKGTNHLKIYMSRLEGSEWTEAIELTFNNDNYSTGHPALSPDGKQLYFISDMPGSIGNTDIFVVDVLGENQFSEPRNLGPEINTERREMFPYINETTLYFASEGHTGLGGLDVYQVPFEGDQGFLEVRNLGQPINSNLDDFSFIMNEATQKGYFASNRQGGKGDDDIYSFKRIAKEPIIENAITGTVSDPITGETLAEALVALHSEDGTELKEVTTGTDGRFVFEDLDSNTKYLLKTEKTTYFNFETPISTKHNETIVSDISLKKLKELIATEDGVMKLKTDIIYFDFDRSYIRKDAASELNKLVEVMNEYKDMIIRVESHTDSRGNAAYNKYLSNQRAISTRDYLISQGIDPSRIQSAIGYGEEQLLNECNGNVRCSADKHQLNRRSEFIIVKM